MKALIALALTACTAPIDPDPGIYPPYAEAGHYRDAAPEADVYMVPACLVEYPDDAGVVAFEDLTCEAGASCDASTWPGVCGFAPL